MQRYRLKLNRLDFVSPVDTPAQETATVVLLKRDRGEEIDGKARVVKMDDSLGLVFCWAFTSSVDNEPYFDLQRDNIDEDFVKAAAEFMERGGATDEMHDGEPDGRVLFAMPMTPEIAKAFGVVTKTTGLMVALKPSPEVYAKFKSGEYTGVSIAGLGEREAVKRGVVKGLVLLTSETDGHQHAIELGCYRSPTTTYATMAGAEQGHAHAWTCDAAGVVTIGSDSGHTHSMNATVPAEVMASWEPREEPVPEPCRDEPSGGTSVVVVTARAKSTPTGGMKQAGLTSTENTMPNEHEKQIADLIKRAERAERLATLSDAQRAHFVSLTQTDADAFLAKSAADRDAEIAKAHEADAVVFKGELTGVEVRKSHGDLALSLAKQNEALAKRQKEQDVELAKARDARETEVLKRRVRDEIGHLAGSDETKVALLKSIDAIADEKVRGEVVTALKAADAIAKANGEPIGTDGGESGGETDPLAAYNKGLAEFAKSKGIENPLDAAPAFLSTEHGKALKSAYDQTRGYGAKA